jgi:hypothetical protein
MSRPLEQRFLHEEVASGAMYDQAVDILRRWAEQLPNPVEPKY